MFFLFIIDVEIQVFKNVMQEVKGNEPTMALIELSYFTKLKVGVVHKHCKLLSNAVQVT